MTDTNGWDIPLQDVDLIAERTLGAPAVSERLTNRLSFGQAVRPIAEPYAPPEWCDYAAGLADQRAFSVLGMVCTFYPEQPESPWIMVKAALGVALTAAGTTAAAPVASLLDPQERTLPVTTTPSTVSVTLNFPFVSAGVQTPVGGSVTEHEWIVRGYGSSQARIRWDFRRTRAYPLVGDHPLRALIEGDPGHTYRGQTLFSAEFKHPVIGLRRYQASLTPPVIPLAS